MEVKLVRDLAYDRAYTLRVGFTDQSYVDLDDPLRLEFDYVRRIADVIDLVAPARQRLRVVHVGGAGLTLPRYVAATRPTSAQLVFEPDQELTALVREQLPLDKRSGIKIRPSGGREGLATLRDDYADVIIIDAFEGSRVPASLGTIETYVDAARVLDHASAYATPVLMINVTDSGDLSYARRVLAGVSQAFPETALVAEPAILKGRRFGNLVIIGSTRPLPLDAVADRAGRAAFPCRVIIGARLDQLIGGAAPLTDADALASPAPPDSLLHRR